MKTPKLTRREFLAAASGTVVGIGLPGTFVKLSDAAQAELAQELRPDGRTRVPPGQHVIQKIADMGGEPGTATRADWRLTIHGEVKRPLTLSFPELMQLEQIDLICDVHCVTGWTLLDSQWRGVRLGTVMEMVHPRPTAGFLIFEAAAGYTTNVPISDMSRDNVILAHTLFGSPLPRPHGAPVRMVNPDRYFYKSAKWLEGIKVTTEDEPGYWERDGFSNTADPWQQQRYSRYRAS